MMKSDIPKEVLEIVKTLQKAGFQAYIVGGCVRDILLGKKPKDWDVTTNAKPEEIQKLFSAFAKATADKPATVYENEFGTVGIKTDSEDPTLKVIEITTFRAEEKYSDKRHPDQIRFVSTLEEDLKRRDFSINAMALQLSVISNQLSGKSGPKTDHRSPITDYRIIDLFGGQEDLEKELIRAVGEPAERFSEDALRMLRAVRFAAELDFSAKGGSASGWTIEEKTAAAIKQLAADIKFIAKERISTELEKIVMSPRPWNGFEMLRELGLLRHIVPELEEGYAVTQNKHHIYTVWEHNMRSLQYAADKNYSFGVRLAALLHDVGKPRAKRGEGPDSTFYGHEVVGAKMAAQILGRLCFPRDVSEKITTLVRNHLFYYETEQVTDASVRRLISRVGPENIQDLVRVREADRIGSGVPKAVPYKLRHFMFRVEKLLKDFPSLKNLKVNGNDVMEILKIQPGPKVGMILNTLFEEILDDPKKNKQEYLVRRIKALGKLSEKELGAKAAEAKKRYEELLQAEEQEIKKKYYVK